MFLRKHQVYTRFYLVLNVFNVNIYLGHAAGCGITEDVSQWMDKVQSSGVDEEPVLLPKAEKVSPKFKKHKPNTPKKIVENYINVEESYNKYSREANENSGRHKRATKREDSKNTCSLYIQTDPLIWRHISEGFPEVSRDFSEKRFELCTWYSFFRMLI